MARLRTAIVGTGGIARSHADAVGLLAEEVDLVAAVDVDPDQLAAFRERYGISAGYDSVDQLLDREQPDLVQICTPPALHIPLSIQCLEAGAWVLCEKPLTVSLADLDRLQAVEERTGRYCGVLFQWRFGAAARHFKQLLERDGLGRPLVAVCNTLWYRPPAYYSVPWRGTYASELGGVSSGLAIHIMDLLLHLLGDWSEIRAMLDTLEREIEVEDVSLAMVRFASGTLCSITNSALSPRQESYLRLDCTRATVELTTLYGYRNESWRVSLGPSATIADLQALPDWQAIPSPEPASHEAALREMLACMRSGARPLTSGREARRTVEFLASLYKSAMTDVPVRRGSITPEDPFYRGPLGHQVAA